MTKPLSRFTRPWSFMTLFATLITTSLAQATSITVKKVKGSQAVIEMSSPLEAGKTYNIEGDALSVQTDYSHQFKSRYNSISLGLNVSLINGNKVVDNTAAFSGRYGWNHTQFEFGPVVDVEVYDKGFGTNTDYLLGGYFDYNYTENKAPRELIYGPSLQFLLGNRNYASGGSAQITQGELAGFLTWFINNSSVALRSELGYLYRRVNTASEETILNGFTGQLFLMYYY